MTKDELSLHNGRDGQKAYVAYKGNIYDVTSSSQWEDGKHHGLSAGMDLTLMMANAPHGDGVFDKFPVVAKLEEDKSLNASQTDSKEKLRTWYQKYHPHPMISHFPIVLHLLAVVLDILFIFSPKEFYAITVYYTFFVATVFGVIAMITGFFSWWINYNLSRVRAFIVKIILSFITLFLGIVGIIIYLKNPDVVYSLSPISITYHLVVFITGINVIIIGYYGGQITWGDKSEYIRGEEGVISKTIDKTEPI